MFVSLPLTIYWIVDGEEIKPGVWKLFRFSEIILEEQWWIPSNNGAWSVIFCAKISALMCRN
jgi:hypothetical protein